MGLLDDLFAIRTEFTDIADEVKQVVVSTVSDATKVGQDLKNEVTTTATDLKSEASSAVGGLKTQGKGAIDGIMRQKRDH